MEIPKNRGEWGLECQGENRGENRTYKIIVKAIVRWGWGCSLLATPYV